METELDFRDIGENYLEHFGKMGMKWGRRKANYDSDSNSSPSSNQPNQSDPEQSYVEVRSHRPEGMSRNGKIATGVVLGAVGIGLVLAMSPGARNVGMNFVKSQKDNFRALSPKSVSDSSPLSTLPKNPGFDEKNFKSGYAKVIKVAAENAKTKSNSKMKSAGKTWAKRLFDMTQTRDTLADMQTRIPKTKLPPTGVFDLKDFMPKVMSTELVKIR